MVRTCEKCGKANQPTRKFCIRCGASLIAKEAPKEKAPLPEAPAATPVAESQPTAPPPSGTEEKWVKPSQVAKDRVRTAGGLTRPKSEFEKAKEAFAKAETVGIDEADGSGVVETRMLRASEVKELLEGPGMMAGGEEIPPPTMMEGSEPLPPEAAHLIPQSAPTQSQIEESILGSKSAYVEHPPEPEPDNPPVDEAPVSADFSSSQYEMDSEPPVLEATTVQQPTDTLQEVAAEPDATGFAPIAQPPPAEPAPAPIPETKPATKPDADLDLVITCPDCGKVINVDMFEYPKDVYIQMGAARLKQARFFVVQGKPNEAMQAVRKARALYEKADDKKGLREVLKLVESLAKAG
ncbi:MAG: zinc ribbon domain-containing protein [Candidatus Thorarchaeota archaeon]